MCEVLLRLEVKRPWTSMTFGRCALVSVLASWCVWMRFTCYFNWNWCGMFLIPWRLSLGGWSLGTITRGPRLNAQDLDRTTKNTAPSTRQSTGRRPIDSPSTMGSSPIHSGNYIHPHDAACVAFGAQKNGSSTHRRPVTYVVDWLLQKATKGILCKLTQSILWTSSIFLVFY